MNKAIHHPLDIIEGSSANAWVKWAKKQKKDKV
jgi:hypothetical protein